MKCPKCGYHSFEHLESCKKCGNDLTEHKAKYNLRGFSSLGLAPQPTPDMTETVDSPVSEGGDVDFGFDFLDEEEPAGEGQSFPPSKEDAAMADAFRETEDLTTFAGDEFSLDDDTEQVSLDQPFGIDAESVPADKPEPGSSGSKKESGSEFSF